MSRDRHAEAVWHNHIATASVQGLGRLALIAPAPRRTRPGLTVTRTTRPNAAVPLILALGVAAAVVAYLL